MSSILMIDLKTNVKIPNVPIIWETNLTNDELLVAYRLLLKDGFFTRDAREVGDFSITKITNQITFRSNLRTFNLKIGEKSCRGRGTREEVTIIYLPDAEWKDFDKTKEKENKKEKRDEDTRINRLNNEMMIKEEISSLIQDGEVCLTKNNLNFAEKYLLRAATIAHRNNIYFASQFESSNPYSALLNYYAQTKKVINGINFLKKYGHGEAYWEQFGKKLTNHIAIGVYREALKSFPKSAKIRKRMAIQYEKTGQLEEAIAITLETIKNGIMKDGTKGGFKGRLLRLEKKKKI